MTRIRKRRQDPTKRPRFVDRQVAERVADRGITFVGIATVYKYFDRDWTPEQIASGVAVPYEVYRGKPNKLMFGGGSLMWECVLGRGGAGDLAYFTSGSTFVGVGDGGAGDDQTLNNLTGGSRFRKQVNGGFPLHVDDFVEDALHCRLEATYSGTQANFHWREWGTFNNGSDGDGRMLQRKAEDLGLKHAGETWVFPIDLILNC